MLQRFNSPIENIELPEKFTFPFHYIPHPLTLLATEELKAHLKLQHQWHEELSQGKMFGVLVVTDDQGELGYLTAFSGNLAGANLHPSFVPPVFDMLQPHDFFLKEVRNISAINEAVERLEQTTDYLTAKQQLISERAESVEAIAKAYSQLRSEKAARNKARQEGCSSLELAELAKESARSKSAYKQLERQWQLRLEQITVAIQHFEGEIEPLKLERKSRSAALQLEIFERFQLLNGRGETVGLPELFRHTPTQMPPAGSAECAAPKLLQYAFSHGLRPIAMGEFWWGASPKQEVRHHGHFYPACNSKCLPILGHMLQGVEVESNPLNESRRSDWELEVVYEDSWLVVVNKPEGMLSVPGKSESRSAFDIITERYPDATGPLLVHRLDMATSGLLLVAKTKETHQALQAQFANRTIKKRYAALLEGVVARPKGTIKLPICLDVSDRPRRMVSEEQGQLAITRYEVVTVQEGRTRIAFYPHTGRTHQLRVHASHPDGLNAPIVGDPLYGTPSDRLHLHAEWLKFQHPITEKFLTIEASAPF